MKRKPREIDSSIIGNKYHKLTILEFAGLLESPRKNKGIYRQSIWLCQCECGNKITLKRNNIVSGNTKSCGCLAIEKNNKLRGKGIQNNILPQGEAAFNAYLGTYKYSAKKRSINFELTNEEFKNLIYTDCYFCGENPNRQFPTIKKNNSRPYNGFIFVNGIDRLDAKTGYTKNNCVACCEICNKAKRDLSLLEFLTWIEKISKHQKNKF